MKIYLAAAAILIAGSQAAWSQTIIPCADPEADLSGSCAVAPLQEGTTGSLDQGTISPSPGTTFTDPGTTSAIPQPETPQGMPPLVVPNDPLGQGIGQNPFGSGSSIGGSQDGINGNGGISSPAIQ
jgi:hypothetical protein